MISFVQNIKQIDSTDKLSCTKKIESYSTERRRRFLGHNGLSENCEMPIDSSAKCSLNQGRLHCMDIFSPSGISLRSMINET